MSGSKKGTTGIAVIGGLAFLLGVGAGYLAATYLRSVRETEQPVFVQRIDTAELAAKVAQLVGVKLAENQGAWISKAELKSLCALPEVKAENASGKGTAAAVETDKAVETPKPAQLPGVGGSETLAANAAQAPRVTSQPPKRPVIENVRPPNKPAASNDMSWLSRAGEYMTKLGSNPAVGPDSALVKVFILSEFQCPVCKRGAFGVEELFAQFGDDVQWIFWNNPLDTHRRALPAAKAAMAAFRQGKFWEYHDLLFSNQQAFDDNDFAGYAAKLNLDLQKFSQDMNDPGLLAKIKSDQAASMKVGARGTPSFLINGKLQVGWGSAAGLGSMVERELEEMKKLVAQGKSREEALKLRSSLNAASPAQNEVFLTHFIGGEPASR